MRLTKRLTNMHVEYEISEAHVEGQNMVIDKLQVTNAWPCPDYGRCMVHEHWILNVPEDEGGNDIT
jgi:hypothetical protein